MPGNILTGVDVKVQPRSGFDKSRKNILTTKVGTITPIAHDIVIPNSDIYMKLAISAALPPLASETFMRASLKIEAFFVPLRLLYGGFESWLTGKELYDDSGNPYRAQLPRMKFTSGSSSYFGPCSLADYLGAQIDQYTFSVGGQTVNTDVYLNAFPFLAYHRIYDDWYRNTKVQKPLFNKPGQNTMSASVVDGRLARLMPYCGFSTIKDLAPSLTLGDSVTLGSLRQRNYGVDKFTACTPNAELGAPMTVQTDSSGLFSISALRSANSIQQWEELQNLTGKREQDYNLANYGAKLPAGIAQRAVYLGSADYPVYSNGVYANQGVTATNNPFTSVGARYGSAYAAGTDFVVKAHFDEHGVIMVLATLVPEANYGRTCSALMQKFIAAGSQVDMPTPMLQNVGNEPVMQTELSVDADFSDPNAIFGYVPRFSWHKTAVNEVHGLLLNGQSLSSFVAKRTFVPVGGNLPQISTNFLQIRTTDLDNVTAVTADLSNYGVWIDSYLTYFVSCPLAKYAIPSLQNPAYEHGVSVHLQNNGSKID